MAEQDKQTCGLRTALVSHVDDVKIKVLVDNSMKHYFDLFRMKATAAKSDVFYIISGMFNTSAERFFLWIGGFRPSELLKVIHGSINNSIMEVIFLMPFFVRFYEQIHFIMDK